VSILATLFGNGGAAVATPVEAVGNVLDKLFTSDEERAQAAAVLEKLRQQPHLLQIEVNKLEAQHRSTFVAGWRPAIGWVCAVSLGWQFLGHPICVWLFALIDPFVKATLSAPPPLGAADQLMPLVVSLLGLGGLRTVEKLKGKSK